MGWFGSVLCLFNSLLNSSSETTGVFGSGALTSCVGSCIGSCILGSIPPTCLDFSNSCSYSSLVTISLSNSTSGCFSSESGVWSILKSGTSLPCSSVKSV